MLTGLCNYSHTKELWLFCAIWAGLLGLSATLAAESRTINFGQINEASSVKTFAVIGEVTRPAAYQLKQNEVTLEQLIKSAGGVTPAAGEKIRILRGGKSILILLRDDQAEFKLTSGDVIILDRQWRSSARTISFDKLNQSASASGSPMIVNRADLRQNRVRPNHGQIVLLGLKSQPVVLPLWGEKLTIDKLLTQYMKQPRKVAARTRVIVGKKNKSNPHLLTAGMILSIPAKLVNHDSIPQLPAAIVIENDSRQKQAKNPEKTGTTSLSPAGSTPIAQLAGDPANQSVPNLSTPFATNADKFTTVKPTVIAYSEIISPETEQAAQPQSKQEQLTLPVLSAQENQPAESETLFVPQEIANETSSEELLSVEPQQTNEGDSSAELNSFVSDFFSTSESAEDETAIQTETDSQAELDLLPGDEQNDFTKLLEEKAGETVHAAQAGEVVPNPVELKKTGGTSMIGFIAGAIVVIGVMTVIISALRNQFSLPEQHLEQKELLVERTEHHSRDRQAFSEKPLPQPPQPAAGGSPNSSTPLSSDPLTRAKQQKEDSLKALLENQIPIIEERVLMPRELKFFGKPNLYYEFRLDSSHEIKKPHLASKMGQLKQNQQLETEPETTRSTGGPNFTSAAKKKRKPSVPVFWEAETGLFVSSSDLYRETTPGT